MAVLTGPIQHSDGLRHTLYSISDVPMQLDGFALVYTVLNVPSLEYRKNPTNTAFHRESHEYRTPP
jgi:hypothetical protein